MNEITFPTQPTSSLIKASIIALVSSSIIFITIILPAEYNIDPTGTGKLMGLTVLSEEAMLSEDVAQPEKAMQSEKQLAKEQSTKQPASSHQENTVTVIVPPNSGVEYKFKMQQYANITYEWTTNGTPLYFDFHGEPKGDTTGYFESYVLATNAEMKGSMTVPFEGVHGWYWKNTSEQQVIVTLKTSGNYEVVGLIH